MGIMVLLGIDRLLEESSLNNGRHVQVDKLPSSRGEVGAVGEAARTPGSRPVAARTRVLGLEVRGATREVNWGLVLLLAGSSPSCGVPPLCRGQAPHTGSPLNLLPWANYFLTVKLLSAKPSPVFEGAAVIRE